MNIFRNLCLILLLIPVISNAKELKPGLFAAEGELFEPEQIEVYGNEIYVLDSKDCKIKIFTAKGEFSRYLGGKGFGPGEFVNPNNFHFIDGKIVVYDKDTQRMHYFQRKSKKFLRFVTLPGYSQFVKSSSLDSPAGFTINPAGFYYFWTVGVLKGDKVLLQTDKNLKPLKCFLDAVPAFKSKNELMNSNSDADLVKVHMNFGYLAASENRVYYAYYLLNKVVEFSRQGKLLATYLLPVESIVKSAKIKQYRDGTVGLSTQLVYDLKVENERLYVLVGKADGSSVIYRLEGKKFAEHASMKESLLKADISGDGIYGIADDQGEYSLVLYNLK